MKSNNQKFNEIIGALENEKETNWCENADFGDVEMSVTDDSADGLKFVIKGQSMESEIGRAGLNAKGNLIYGWIKSYHGQNYRIEMVGDDVSDLFKSEIIRVCNAIANEY